MQLIPSIALSYFWTLVEFSHCTAESVYQYAIASSESPIARNHMSRSELKFDMTNHAVYITWRSLYSIAGLYNLAIQVRTTQTTLRTPEAPMPVLATRSSRTKDWTISKEY